MVMAVGIGVVAGLLSGLFGVGGGIIMVPALVYLLGMDQKLAHGTSLASVAVLAVSSGVSYAIAGEVAWTVAALLALGSTVGAWFGAKLLSQVEARLAGTLFTVLLVVTAIRIAMGGGDSGTHRQVTLIVGFLLIVGGVLAGVVSGLLGVGGGSVLVPMMIVGLGMPTVMAKGTSLAVIIVGAVVGTIGNRRHSNIDFRVAVLVGLSGIVFGFLGGQVSLGLPDRVADGLFAGLLTIVAMRMGWDLYRSRGDGTKAVPHS